MNAGALTNINSLLGDEAVVELLRQTKRQIVQASDPQGPDSQTEERKIHLSEVLISLLGDCLPDATAPPEYINLRVVRTHNTIEVMLHDFDIAENKREKAQRIITECFQKGYLKIIFYDDHNHQLDSLPDKIGIRFGSIFITLTK